MICIKKREYLFDNLKAVLIILVVFGHVIESFELQGIFLKIKGVIYVFHMPLFIFISGYFSKKLENTENKSIKNLLIPFFIFNTMYMIISNKTIYINVLEAVYLYWYLISLFMWKTFTKYIIKFRFSLILLFLASIYIGFIDDANRFLSISRTIAFWPFFMLGYYAKSEHIEWIRKLSKKLTIPILLTLVMIVFILSNDIINVELFKNAQSYNTSEIGNLEGIIIRLFQFIIAIGISICLINLVSDKKSYMSVIGERTITVYILSPFVQKVLIKLAKNTILINYNTSISLITCLVITFITVILCFWNKVYNLYNKFIDWIYNRVTIEEKIIE